MIVLAISYSVEKDEVDATVTNAKSVKSYYTRGIETNPYTPQQIGSVYMKEINYNGEGQKIAVISCFNYKNLQRDFDVFCKKYDLPMKQLKSYSFGSKISKDWDIETALDTQWSHVFAPKADIYVIQASDNSYLSLKKAIEKAIELNVDIVTMSLGSDESSYAIDLIDDLFSTNPNIIFLSSSGDWQTVSYPSSSRHVMSVGGTCLGTAWDNLDNSKTPKEANYNLNPGIFQIQEETDWFNPDGSGTGHGISKFFKKQNYQTNKSIMRSTPDFSLIAATPSRNGVSIYSNGKWYGVEGTSVSSPIFAGMMATINSKRLSIGKQKLNRETFLSNMYAQLKPNLPFNTGADGFGYINELTIPFCINSIE